jgi:hypothetical protein
MSHAEYENIFSMPSTASMIFLVNLKDVRNEGVKNIVNNSIKYAIPERTEVVVDNYTFTLLNDIEVTVYNNKEVFVEQITNSKDISVNEIGILESNVIIDDSNVEWIIFETLVKQVKINTIEDTVITSTGFSKEFTLEEGNKYHTARIYYKNTLTNNKWVSIESTHSDMLYNRTKPIVKIDYIGNTLNFTIPTTYLNDKMISGNIKIDVYTTRGKVDLSLHQYNIEDFEIALGDTGKNELTAISPNVTTMARSRVSVNGGKDGKTVNEIREGILYNTAGKHQIPITEYELSEESSISGYNIHKVLDTITNRVYTASKKTPIAPNKNIMSRIDIFNFNARIDLSELLDSSFIINDDDKFIIKSNTVFKVDNGVTKILTKAQVDVLSSLSRLELSKTLTKNKYLVNPFYYIVDKSDNVVNTKVYNLDYPVLANLKINNRLESNIKVNISSYKIDKVDDGYKLIFKPVSSKYFDNLNKALVKMELMIPVSNDNDLVKFTTTLDPVSKLFVININSDLHIKNGDRLNITNGNYKSNFKDIKLSSKAKLFIYSTDPTVISNTNTLNDSITETGEVFVQESLDIVFGEEIKYLWNKISLEYNSRKYKTALSDVPLTYTEDVYEFFKETNSIFKPSQYDNKCEAYKNLDYNVIHKKGDFVYDNGKQIFKYKAGDVLKDYLGNPIVDKTSGVIRYIDILGINYENVTATNVLYKEYLKQYISDINQWVLIDMERLNSRVLDNTIIQFKPYKTVNDIKVINNGKVVYIPSTVSPKVTLYIDRTINVDTELLKEFKTITGNILHNELETKHVSIATLKSKIDKALPINLKCIKISGITKEELEVFNLKTSTERLSLNKVLTSTPNNDTIVEYDIVIDIAKI